MYSYTIKTINIRISLNVNTRMRYDFPSCGHLNITCIQYITLTPRYTDRSSHINSNSTRSLYLVSGWFTSIYTYGAAAAVAAAACAQSGRKLKR